MPDPAPSDAPSATTPVCVGIGSNLGRRRAHILEAVTRLESQPGIRLHLPTGLAPMYETTPVGPVPQGAFLNTAVRFESHLAPADILRLLQRIERDMGRRREVRWGPRVIDLDLLLWGGRVVRSRSLMLPHPHLPRRRFVLEPLAEIAGTWQHPTLRRSVRDLRDRARRRYPDQDVRCLERIDFPNRSLYNDLPGDRPSGPDRGA